MATTLVIRPVVPLSRAFEGPTNAQPSPMTRCKVSVLQSHRNGPTGRPVSRAGAHSIAQSRALQLQKVHLQGGLRAARLDCSRWSLDGPLKRASSSKRHAKARRGLCTCQAENESGQGAGEDSFNANRMEVRLCGCTACLLMLIVVSSQQFEWLRTVFSTHTIYLDSKWCVQSPNQQNQLCTRGR